MNMNFPFDHDQPEHNWDDVEWTENRNSSTDSPMDFDLMMSMALDGMLDEDELAQFHTDIEYYPLLGEQWATWQELDEKLLAEPSAMPPPDFVQNFEARLLKKQRRHKVWLGVGIAAVTIFLWASIIVSTLSAGAFIAVNQGSWINEQIHSMAYLVHGFTTWFHAASNTLSIAFSSPQMWGIGLAYAALMGGILVYWTRLLRRSMGTVTVNAA